MLKGMIAINDPNGVYNPYIPVGIYVRITIKEMNDPFILKLCEGYVPRINKLPLIIISYKDFLAINSNQNSETERILLSGIKEIEALTWTLFQIIPILHQSTGQVCDYVFQLLRS